MTHELYLIRHGIAANRGPGWPDDTKRPLTERGIFRLRKSARGLRELGATLDLVMTSPLARALQSAEIVAAAFEPRPHVVTTEALAPGAAWSALAAELGKHARHRRIAIVGHEPDLGGVAAKLIGARQPIAFKKGAICRIDVDLLPPEPPGALRWFVTPKMLRSLGA